jgi:MFS family permease
MTANDDGATAGGDAPTIRVPRRQEFAVYAIAVCSHVVSRMAFLVVPLWAVSLDTPPVVLGIVIGAYQLPSLFLSIPAGALMDRLGPRRMMIYFALTMAIFSTLYPALPWVAPLIALQMIVGSAASMSWMGAQTLLARMMRGSAAHAGRMTISAHTGSFLGPMIAGPAWDLFGPWGAFLAMSAAGLLMVAIVSILPAEKDRAAAPLQKGDLAPHFADYRDAFKLLALPMVAVAFCASILDHAASGMRNSFYVVWLDEIGLTGTAIGALISVTSVAAVLTALKVGWLTSLFRDTWVLLVSFALGIVLISITPVLGSFTLLFIVAAVRGGVLGFGHPLTLSMVSRSVSENDQGKAIGLRLTGNRISDILTPVAMGAAVEGFGLEKSFYVVGGVLLVMIFVLAIHVRRADHSGQVR